MRRKFENILDKSCAVDLEPKWQKRAKEGKREIVRIKTGDITLWKGQVFWYHGEKCRI